MLTMNELWFGYISHIVSGSVDGAVCWGVTCLSDEINARLTGGGGGGGGDGGSCDGGGVSCDGGGGSYDGAAHHFCFCKWLNENDSIIPCWI